MVERKTCRTACGQTSGLVSFHLYSLVSILDYLFPLKVVHFLPSNRLCYLWRQPSSYRMGRECAGWHNSAYDEWQLNYLGLGSFSVSLRFLLICTCEHTSRRTNRRRQRTRIQKMSCWNSDLSDCRLSSWRLTVCCLPDARIKAQRQTHFQPKYSENKTQKVSGQALE